MNRQQTLAVVIGGLALGVTAHPAFGELITFEFAGEITHIQDDNGILGDAVTVGSPFSGLYTFESTTPDSDPDEPGAGTYIDAITTISGYVGGLPFSGPVGPKNFVWVRKYSSVVYDLYLVGTGIDVLGIAETLRFRIGLQDATGTAFVDDSLPLSPPPLEEFDSTRFTLEAESERLRLGGEITYLVPEPGSVILLGCAAVLLVQRRGGARVRPV